MDEDPTVIILSLPEDPEDYAQVSLSDEDGFSYIQVAVQDRISGIRMIAYESLTGFYHPFNGQSSVTGSGTTIDPYILKIYRRGRWPTGISIEFQVKAIDSIGYLIQAS